MAFENSIAKYCFQRFERSLEVFPFDEEAIINKFEEFQHSISRRKSVKKADNMVMNELINFIGSQRASLFMSEVDLASPYYGGKSQFIEILHLARGARNDVKLRHTMIQRSKKRVTAMPMLDMDVRITGHAVDRIYDRFTKSDVRRDPRQFAICTKGLLASLGVALEAKHFGISFHVAVPGGSFICERNSDGVLVKTFLGDKDWTDEQTQYLENRSLKDINELVGQSDRMRAMKEERENFRLGCRKMRVLGSHMWLPSYDGLEIVH